MRSFDWEALVPFALQHLKLRPAEFWALTPAELRMMIGPVGARAPLSRSALDGLMARFPDQPNEASEEI